MHRLHIITLVDSCELHNFPSENLRNAFLNENFYFAFVIPAKLESTLLKIWVNQSLSKLINLNHTTVFWDLFRPSKALIGPLSISILTG